MEMNKGIFELQANVIISNIREKFEFFIAFLETCIHY